MKASANLPVTCDLSPRLHGLARHGASVAGLLAPAGLYPTEALRQSFLANDVVNLLLGAPALTRRGKLLGLLFWPGGLFYATYNYRRLQNLALWDFAWR